MRATMIANSIACLHRMKVSALKTPQKPKFGMNSIIRSIKIQHMASLTDSNPSMASGGMDITNNYYLENRTMHFRSLSVNATSNHVGAFGDQVVDETGPDTDHTQVTDKEDFEKAATNMVTKLANSVEHMKKHNRQFEVNLSPESDMLSLDLSPVGKVLVEVDRDNCCIAMTTPYSGRAYTYFLSKETGEWLEWSGQHELEGLFVRDLNQLCDGVPDL